MLVHCGKSLGSLEWKWACIIWSRGGVFSKVSRAFPFLTFDGNEIIVLVSTDSW